MEQKNCCGHQKRIKNYVIILLLALINWCECYGNNSNVPCNFWETVNITNGIRNDDGSITHNRITYTEQDYAEFNYTFLNKTHRKDVEPHLRACTCNDKPCVRLCCEPGQVYRPGIRCHPYKGAFDVPIDVYKGHNEVAKVQLEEYFSHTWSKPCDQVYMPTSMLKNLTKVEDEWRLLENGRVLHVNKQQIHEQNDYCLMITEQQHTRQLSAKLVLCFGKSPSDIKYTLLPYCMLASIPFLLATFFVYVCLPELRNMHGKCLLCYLIGLTVGYFTLALVQLNGSNYVAPTLCHTAGFIIYFSFLSAFFWLNVISFDLWWNFKGMKGIKKIPDTKRFILYFAYAYGSTLFITILAYIMDSMTSIPLEWRPGFGLTNCFLKREPLSEFIYLYLPTILILCTNIIFFILTAKKIRHVQIDLARITAKEESQMHKANLQREKDRYTIFLRLFIIMGVTWCMEPISWMISPDHWSFYLTDACNCIQGVLIFLLFVMKRKIYRLLRQRLFLCLGKPISTGNATDSSSGTRTSNVKMSHLNLHEQITK